MKKSICVVTSTRAEYGLLKPLMTRIKNENKYELNIVVTGMHLSPEFGSTYKEIEADGFKIADKVEILVSSDTPTGIAKSMGLANLAFAEVFQKNRPDFLIVLGDRYEIFSVCSVASVFRIPIAHIHGGETTEGAFDEAFRHSITKMSYLHFTSTDDYRRRVIQLGEDPSRTFNVGAMGVENIKTLDLLSKEELEESIDFKLDKKFGLVTFHPVTLESSSSIDQFKSLLNVLDYMKEMKFIITKANSDNEGRAINKLIDEYGMKNPNRIKVFTSMGYLRYLSAMKICSCVIGNSSSGIIEAPSFNVPTINIGDRQKGRVQGKSVINCIADFEHIKEGIEKALSEEFIELIKNEKNPYGDGCTSIKIYNVIDNFLEGEINLKKKFYDLT